MLVQLDRHHIEKLLDDADHCPEYEGSLGVVCGVLRQVCLIEEYVRYRPLASPFFALGLVSRTKISLEELFSRVLVENDLQFRVEELLPVTWGRRMVEEFRLRVPA